MEEIHMSNFRSVLSVVACTIALTLWGGCKSSIEKQFEAEQIVISPPLDHDPTDNAQLAQWWASEKRLLRLEESAAYSLFEGTNRYALPVERGRWSQHSYAALWLEPYNTMRVQPRRVSISKINGRLALTLPGGGAPLFALQHPPVVLEDRVIGMWDGPLGALQLMDNLRYSLSPRSDDGVAGAPHIYAMRKGNWKIADTQLVLLSDIPGVEPLRLPLTVNEKSVTISAPGGTMTRAQPQSTVAAPASEPTATK
jgi:hypothetical protein